MPLASGLKGTSDEGHLEGGEDDRLSDLHGLTIELVCHLIPFFSLCTIASMKTCMVIPDLQIPLHDKEFVQKLIDVANYVRPDSLVFIGDLTDSTEVGRWVKGRSGEYTGDLQAAFDEAAKTVSDFRKAVGRDCEMILIDSNHDSRTQEYISANAPALHGLRALDLVQLLALGASGCMFVRGPFEAVPGVHFVHGHERAYSSIPGKYGLERIRDYGGNVVYGHTHTPLVVTTARGTGENRENFWAMNVGHGMDMGKAGYLKDGYATWNQAFGLVHWDNGQSYPELVLAQNGSFVFDGEEW